LLMLVVDIRHVSHIHSIHHPHGRAA
jgi:hypothetical protein